MSLPHRSVEHHCISAPVRSALHSALVAALAIAVAGCSQSGDRSVDSATATFSGASAATGDPLIVFAASDLRDALGDAARAYRTSGGDSVTLVFGSTGDLGAQIANGAPADIFFAANAAAIDSLAAHRQIIDSTRAVYAIGRLVLIAKCASPPATNAAAPRCDSLTIGDLSRRRIKSIAIANPAHAPYGLAAKQALERSGVWQAVEPKLVMGANISQAEQFVATGNADAGLIALSLVLRDSTRRYTLIDSSLHAPLRQTLAVMASSKHAARASNFVRYVRGAGGQAVMRRYGFTAPP